MKPLSTPRRLLEALALPRSPAPLRAEPVLALDSLPPLPQPAAAPRLVRRAIERELEEGSRRVYVPMQETEVIEPPRQHG